MTIIVLLPPSLRPTGDFPPRHRKLSSVNQHEHDREYSSQLRRSRSPRRPTRQNGPAAMFPPPKSLAHYKAKPISRPCGKNFVTKPEKSPHPTANPHRISKRISKNPEILGFDIVKSRVRWPFSRVRWAQNRPYEPNQSRATRHILPRLCHSDILFGECRNYPGR